MRSRGAWITAGAALLTVGAIEVGGAHATGTARDARAGKARPHARVARKLGHHRVVVWARGSWCWFQDPRAVNVTTPRDETFVGWIDWRGRITVGAYEPGPGVIESHVVGHQAVDDHGSPSILVEPDGRLTVFWSGHDGPRMNYRTTRRPEDISSWTHVRHVHSRIPGGRGFTYPNPVMLPAERNKLYLFFRGADWSSDFATRTRSGHWSRVRRLISLPGQRPYLKVASDGRGTIAFAFTDGHPRETTTSIFYAAYRHGSLWTARGRRIGRMAGGPITPDRAERVYDGPAAGVSGWVWDVAFDHHHRPVIVYATFPSPDRHLYWYAHFEGGHWVSHLLTVGGPTISPGTIETEYSGGLALDHTNPSTVYLSRQVRGWFEIERWRTDDGGARWHHSTVVRTPGRDDLRPVVPRGSDTGGIKLLWLQGHYGSYTHYRTSIAFLR